MVEAPREGAAARGDVLLLNALFADDADERQAAEAARRRGSLLIGIGPPLPAAAALAGLCDFWVSNCSPEPGGAMLVGGEWLCPTTGIVGCVLAQVLVAAVCEALAARGLEHTPYFLKGVHWVGGSEHNEATKAAFEARGY